MRIFCLTNLGGILLLDPRLKNNNFRWPHSPIPGHRSTYPDPADPKGHIEAIPNYPYLQGYRDFTSWPENCSHALSPENVRGPERSSLLDDIVYYWTVAATREEIFSAINSPYQSSMFLRKIVASTWLNSMEYFNAILSEAETRLWDIEGMVAPDLSDDEKDTYMAIFTVALNEVNSLRRRLAWYLNEMRLNLEALNLAPGSPVPKEKKHDEDFLALYERLQTHQSWAEKLLDVINTSVNLMETEKSMANSKSLSRLTILGFVFVPVSFMASFFSMGGDFAVGESRFWVYFVVTVPLTLAILGLAFRKHLVEKMKKWI